MTWFRADDTLAFSASVVRAGNAAMGLWVRAGTWCAQQLTDGHVPHHIAATLGSPAQIRRLVEAGLWHPTDDGFLFHEWNATNPTRAEVENRRQSEAKKKTAFRQRRAGQPGVSTGESPGVSTGESPGVSTVDSPAPRPDPTRPIPNTHPPAPLAGEGEAQQGELPLDEEEPARTRAKPRRRIPADWQPSPGVRANVDERFPGWEQRETVEEFRDYWLAAGRPMADWDLTWRNRVREVAARPPRTATGNGHRGRSEPYRNPPPGSYKIERQSFL